VVRQHLPAIGAAGALLPPGDVETFTGRVKELHAITAAHEQATDGGVVTIHGAARAGGHTRIRRAGGPERRGLGTPPTRLGIQAVWTLPEVLDLQEQATCRCTAKSKSRIEQAKGRPL
jgi:hypothetical protein